MMSAAQFRRGISRCMDKGRSMTEKEYNILISYYTNPSNGLVNYRDFVHSIEKSMSMYAAFMLVTAKTLLVFGDKHLEENPHLQVVNNYHDLKTKRSVLTNEQDITCKRLVEKLRSYVQHHGSDVKSWYKDFDKHNSGFVTYNQVQTSLY
jgi:Ca2+-binding EF-hand superfamily protein